MKITNKKALIATVVTGALALIVLSTTSVDSVASLMGAGSYVAVAVLFVFATVGYRVAPKSYLAR